MVLVSLTTVGVTPAVADVAGFEGFARTYGPAAVRAGRLLAGDWDSGRDLAQEAVIRLYLAWPRLRDPDAAWAYLHRTMLRLQLRHHHRSSRELPVAQVPDIGIPEPAPADDALMAAIARLPTRQRATLVLRFFLDLSIEDTARSMGCSIGTVKSQTADGLATLRTLLGVTEQDKEHTP
jgi:RNA polymerase sigma-70 factor (sigma-E family)